MSENKPEKTEIEWLVQFPDKEKVTRFVRPSLEAACHGNERIASVLNYFLYESVKEAKKQGLEKGCKVVIFARKHQDITDRLNFPLSRKTLIRYLDLLNEWEYVTSERYQKTFIVNHEKIQEAINNPPTKPVKYQWLQEKRCKVEYLQPSESCTDTTLEDPKKVVELQQKVEWLQEKVVELQQKVDIFTTLQPYLEAWIQAAGAPVSESLRIYHNNPDSSSSNIVVSASAPTTSLEVESQENSYSREPQQPTLLEVEETKKKEQPDKPSPSQKKTGSKKKIIPEVQRERPEMPSENAEWTPATIRGMFNHWRGHAPLTQGVAVQQNNAANALYQVGYTRKQITKVYEHMCKQQYWIDKGGVEIWNVANNIAKVWNQIKPAEPEPSPTPEQKPPIEFDPNKLVRWTRYQHPGAAVDHWYLYELMPISEALKLGWKKDAISSNDKLDIRTRLKMLAEGEIKLTPEQQAEKDTAELRLPVAA